MLSVRKINISLIALISLVSLFSFAAAGTFRSTTDLLNSQGSASTISQDSSMQSRGLTQSFDMISPTLNKNWTISSSVKLSKLDSSQLTTKGAKGQDILLDAKDNQTTSVLSAGVTYNKGIATSTMMAGQSVDSSVYQTRTFSLESLWTLNSMTTNLGIQFSRLESDRPQNYFFDNFFSDASLRWQLRPNRITRDRWTGSVEQIWNDNYKTRTELWYQQRNQERPQAAGLEIKNGYSLNSRQVLRADIGTASEDRRQTLLDERGYFQMNWLEAAYSQGLTYNFWLTVSYGMLQEIESEPRSGRKTQMGSDIYGLKALYSGRGWKASIKWESLESNNDFKSQQMQGALEWEI